MITTFFRRLLGIAQGDQRAHDIKNQIQRDVLQIHLEMHKKELTAYRIAKAAGRVR